MQLTIEQVFSPPALNDLRETGYSVGTMQIGNVLMHVIAVHVDMSEGGDVDDVSDMQGSTSDFDAIFSLMGDSSGPPMLLDWEGRTYLLGACPYSR